MVEISIGLGIILSLVLSEALGVTAGGIIVPGYISLFLQQPVQVFSTFFVAILVWLIIKGLSKVMFLYGKRRIVLALILGFFFGYLSRIIYVDTESIQSVAVIGNIIPGLIAAATALIPRFCPDRSNWYFISLTKFLNAVLNKSASI